MEVVALVIRGVRQRRWAVRYPCVHIHAAKDMVQGEPCLNTGESGKYLTSVLALTLHTSGQQGKADH